MLYVHTRDDRAAEDKALLASFIWAIQRCGDFPHEIQTDKTFDNLTEIVYSNLE